MKYKVQIYCTVPKFIEITNQMERELKINNRVLNGCRELIFDNKEELFHYVRSKDYVKFDVIGVTKSSKKFGKQDLKNFAHIPDAIGNRVLEATMTHPNDSKRFKQTFYGNYHDFYFIGYLIKDEQNRVIDLRNYEAELYKFNYEEYSRLIRKKRDESLHKLRAELDNEWVEWEADMKKRMGFGWEHQGYYRNFRTLQERRRACDEEHKPYIRGKRRRRSLPEPWGTEIPIAYVRSWKNRRKSISLHAKRKFKYQWQINLPTHIDTVYFNKRAYELDEIDE